MNGIWRSLAVGAVALAAACGGDGPELGREADIEVDSAAPTGPAQDGAVEEVVEQLRGEPGLTIYLPPPDLGEPDPRALFPGPGGQAVLAAPPPPVDTQAEPPAGRQAEPAADTLAEPRADTLSEPPDTAASAPGAPPRVRGDTASAPPPDTARAERSRRAPGYPPP